MRETFTFLYTEYFIIFIFILEIILLILYFSNLIKQNKIKKNYSKLLKKLGNGNNIEEILKRYIEKVEDVDNKINEIDEQISIINNNLSKSIKKVGIVRYNAFKNMGSDLSFTLALLDDNNDGIVLNGIYSRELSNIYAKPIKHGESEYTLSEEEKQAIQRAINV